jgi:cytochrome c oxidase assembly factor CtaG
LADQQAGGGVMMLGGDLITLIILVVVFVQWSKVDERAATRADAALASGSVSR